MSIFGATQTITDTPRTHLGEICRLLASIREGMAMAKSQKSTVKLLLVMVAGSALTWAAVMAAAYGL
jgi:hypothetical protein